MTDLKLVSDEELRKIIADAENELYHRKNKKLIEKKAEAKRAIEELIAVAQSQGRYTLGELYIECAECGDNFYLDILGEDILKDIAVILGS